MELEGLRRALGHLYKQTSSRKISSFALQMPQLSIIDAPAKLIAQQVSVTLGMAAYDFVEFITTDQERKEKYTNKIIVCVPSKDLPTFKNESKDGEIISQAVNKARHWINLPPMQVTPHELAQEAKKIAKKCDLKITVFDEKEIKKMGMGGLAGVSAGSDLDCHLVIMEYKTKKKNAPTIAFVGKGITFDSGGLSLKPAQSMETMKDDMSGAAAVIAGMEALAQLKPDVNIIGVAPLAENLPSGKATKPGDIVRFYNDKTAEVKNTDAEGRLILADALSYTVKHYKPDVMIDFATLTGACAYALGPFFSGMMSMHDELVDLVQEAADRSGDRVWRLPLHDDYEPAIKSDVADLQNIGNQQYMAGAITAARFLKHFVGETPWVHLDIAGTAFNVPDIPYYRTGATGVGVRLMVDFAMNYNK
jgi:leucyl aminopeptidase